MERRRLPTDKEQPLDQMRTHSRVELETLWRRRHREELSVVADDRDAGRPVVHALSGAPSSGRKPGPFV